MNRLGAMTLRDGGYKSEVRGRSPREQPEVSQKSKGRGQKELRVVSGKAVQGGAVHGRLRRPCPETARAYHGVHQREGSRNATTKAEDAER